MAKRATLIILGFLLRVHATPCLGHVLRLRTQQTERPGNSRDDRGRIP